MRKSVALLTAAALLVGCNGGERQVETGTKQAEAKAPPTYFQVDPATAGTVMGKVSYKGPKPVRKTINVKEEEPECATGAPTLAEDMVVGSDGSLANVFVYVSKGLEAKAFAPPEGPAQFDQKNCMFHPHVIGVRAGQRFIVSNSDAVRHNVHPIPMENPEWNQGQRPNAPPIERMFEKPEIGILMKCNVHSWMNAYVNVVDHPYFMVTGEDGAFTIPNLPPGEYTLTAWHEKLGTTEQKITVAASGKATADFGFTK